jgi:hypothetical protein
MSKVTMEIGQRLIIEKYVQDAYDRLKNVPNPKMTDGLHKFICDCVGHLPATYGPKIQNKIIRELKAIVVSSDKERGDFRKNITFFEVKCSFLSKGVSYSITNIRNWHNFDYYVLCFIDVTNNFTPNFYVIKKDDINNFKLRGMNGTAESNTVNQNVGMRTAIQVDSPDMELLKSLNLLKDNSFESLYEFVDSFKMKKDKPKGYKFKFLDKTFDSDNTTENYINFLKFFILINRTYEYCGLDIIKASLGKFCSFDRQKLSPCSRRKKQYVRLYDAIYVSTYTSTQKKINHIRKIMEHYNSGVKHSVSIEVL